VKLRNLTTPLRNKDVTLRAPSCWSGSKKLSLPASGSRATLTFIMTFRPSGSVSELPGNTPTERLTALSNKTCSLEVSLWPLGSIATGTSVKLPRVAAQTISRTWNLKNFTTPSGKKLNGSASPPGICSPLSIGKAGTFQIGVVKYNHDLSFQIRNAPVNVSCRYETSPRMEVKQGWVITEVDWHLSGDNVCRLGGGNILHFEWSPGHWGAGDSHDATHLYPVRLEGTCTVNTRDRARNNHVFRATLRKITLVGPLGLPWHLAFK
jgi:hypothetical protein